MTGWAPSATGDPTGPSAPAEAAPLTILLADDDAATLRLLEAVVRRLGHRSISVPDGAEALDRIAKEPVDMLISDIQMPNLSGIDLCRAVRDGSHNRYIFTVLISGCDERDLAFLLDAGADDFITKPIVPSHLQARIRAGQRIVASERKLQTVNRALADRMREIDAALTHAEEIQRLMLPTLQTGPGYRARHVWMPSQNLSGDIMAAVDFADGTTLFYSFDVSGHGIRAALQATELFHVIEATARGHWRTETGFDLRAFVTRLNGIVFEKSAYSYGVGCFLHLKPNERCLDVCFAGTDAIFIGSAKDGWRPIHRPGFPIGLFEALLPEIETVAYRQGDVLIVRSDGLDLPESAMGSLVGRLIEIVVADGLGSPAEPPEGDPVSTCIAEALSAGPHSTQPTALAGKRDDVSVSLIHLTGPDRGMPNR